MTKTLSVEDRAFAEVFRLMREDLLPEDQATNAGLVMILEATGRPLDPNPFTKRVQDTLIANRCARSAGAVGAMPIALKHLMMMHASPYEAGQVLDFGAGPMANHTAFMRSNGYKVTAYDFGLNLNERHDSDALDRKYDIVMAANVLNVQASAAAMARTIAEIAEAVEPGGVAVFNYPESPRKLGVPSDAVLPMLGSLFYKIDRVGGTKSAPLWEAMLS